MATVLLVNPAGIFEECEVKLNPSYPPLGLAYIGAYLKKLGHKVKILDMLGTGYTNKVTINNRVRVGLKSGDIVKNLGEYNPDIIGIANHYTKSSSEAHRTAGALKKIYERAIIIMGGAHCSVLPEKVLSDHNVDLVCIGEGEITLEEIARMFNLYGKDLLRVKNVQTIRGLAFKHNGAIHYTETRKLIDNIDDLPLPAREMLPMKNYFCDQKENPYLMRWPMTSIITSRGCPYNCVYCSARSVWGRSWRYRSPKMIVDEIEHLTKAYGIRELAINDDALACNQKRLKDICCELVKRKIDIRWSTPNGVAVWLLDRECISLMKKAGCYRLTFGLETGDDETARFIRKHYDRDKAIEIIRYANRKGFWTIGTFIIGFPMETIKAMINTLSYARQSEVDMAVFYSAYPFPGTDLNRIYNEMGLSIINSGSVTEGGTDTKYFKSHEITKIRNKFTSIINLHRVLNGYKVAYKLRSVEDIVFLLHILVRGVKNIVNSLKSNTSASGILRG